jgi:hypothetical protein
MIDGFVLLAPLILLPIILLFVFVGCPLDSEGTQYMPVHLVYGPGFETNESIEVTFQFRLPSGDEPLDRRKTETINKQDIDPNGGGITAWGVMYTLDDGKVECKCTIETSQGNFVPVPLETCPKEKGEDFERRFNLSRDGDSFILACEELPMEGEVG